MGALEAPMVRTLALFLAMLAPAPSLAGPRAWTSDDVLALRSVSDPQASPDGRWVAYVVQSLNEDKSAYQTDVWLVPVSGGEARQLTASPKNDESPRWSPDGKWLAFLSERPRPGAPEDGEEGQRQVWLIRPDGGEPTALTSAGGGVTAFEWSPNGKAIGHLAREAKSEERKKREKEKDDAWTPSERYPWGRLWTIDLAGREARQLTKGDLHVSAFSFSPDGDTIAFAGQPTPLIPDNFNADLYLIPASGGDPRPLVERLGAEASPRWSPDGKWIAFLSQDGKNRDWFTNTYLCLVAAEGGVPRNLAPSLELDRLGAGSGLAWSPDSQSLVIAALRRTTAQVFRVSLDGRVEALTEGAALSGTPSLDGAGRLLAFLREDPQSPREVWTLKLPDGEPSRLTDTNPQVKELLAFEKELVTWKGADGWGMEGLLVYPPGYVAGTRVPLVLNVHGGPAGTHLNTYPASSRLWAWPLVVQEGYAVFLPNPRGSGGYGERFRAANVRDWGGKDYQDLMLGIDALVKRGIADPARLAVTGWSYGGFMTSTIVTKTDRFRAAIVGAAVTNLASFTGTTDIPDFARSYFASWPWEDPEAYVRHSALFHAGKVKTPSLVVHGDRDDRVPPSQGWEFYTALKKAGVETDLLVLPRQPHGIREPKLLRRCHERFLDWLNRHTLGRTGS
jgi:dipeptidyl aminopeptidase/acylaminoacyl peptidase